MQRRLILEFTKMNGSGNDFIVVDNRFYHFSPDELSDLAGRLCRRRVSVGADGLLAFMPPHDDKHHYRMKYYNADGSLGTMCGNGACCLARFARQAGFHDPVLHFESDAGVYKVEPGQSDTAVKLFVPNPRDIRTNLADPAVENGHGAIHYIWTGTEHAVCFVNDLENAPVDEMGSRIRKAPLFAPDGVNVNFVKVASKGDADSPAVIDVRTYEKGVECETLACGTGALASGILAGVVGAVDVPHTRVRMAGGTLGVGYRTDGDRVADVYLEGKVETVYRGTLEV